MRRRSRRSTVVAAIVGLLAIGVTDGCTLDDVEITVIGRDRDGQLVVGGSRCDDAGGEVTFEVVGGQVFSGAATVPFWSATRDPYRSTAQGTTGPADTRPLVATPVALDEVRLYVVGSEHADLEVHRFDRTTSVPEIGIVSLTASYSSFEVDPVVDIDLAEGADTYVVDVNGSLTGPISGADAAARIAERCEEAEFDNGRFLTVSGIGGLVVVASCVLIGIATTRQWRRAGARHRAEQASRRGY